MAIKSLPKEKVETLLKQLEKNLALSERLSNEPHQRAGFVAYGAAKAAIENTISQLKGERYL